MDLSSTVLQLTHYLARTGARGCDAHRSHSRNQGDFQWSHSSTRVVPHLVHLKIDSKISYNSSSWSRSGSIINGLFSRKPYCIRSLNFAIPLEMDHSIVDPPWSWNSLRMATATSVAISISRSLVSSVRNNRLPGAFFRWKKGSFFRNFRCAPPGDSEISPTSRSIPILECRNQCFHLIVVSNYGDSSTDSREERIGTGSLLEWIFSWSGMW